MQEHSLPHTLSPTEPASVGGGMTGDKAKVTDSDRAVIPAARHGQGAASPCVTLSDRVESCTRASCAPSPLLCLPVNDLRRTPTCSLGPWFPTELLIHTREPRSPSRDFMIKTMSVLRGRPTQHIPMPPLGPQVFGRRQNKWLDDPCSSFKWGHHQTSGGLHTSTLRDSLQKLSDSDEKCFPVRWLTPEQPHPCQQALPPPPPLNHVLHVGQSRSPIAPP
ncbi:unnamed protein product [Pleuronectes platessa]|uniref:Uncharacterized protein n=1 Tax=Pleuronectes platessa TaxID=8262 RepID=A0A9N7YIS6_PLEPL|nr:unnamed protein product [Pleuronectes platessa]